MRTNQAAIETKTKYDNKKNKKGEGSVVKKKKKKKIKGGNVQGLLLNP